MKAYVKLIRRKERKHGTDIHLKLRMHLASTLALLSSRSAGRSDGLRVVELQYVYDLVRINEGTYQGIFCRLPGRRKVSRKSSLQLYILRREVEDKAEQRR